MDSGWTWQRALKRAAEVLREDGARSLWFKILGETGYRRLMLMERPLEESITAVRPRLPVVIGLLRETEVDDYIDFHPAANPPEIRRRLEAGHWCFVARYDGRVVHAGWAATQRAWIDYLACEIRLAPDEVYVYDSFTSPDFRGKNISPARHTQALLYFQDAGYRRIVAVILPENKPAFKVFEKVGFRPLGLMGYVKIGPWRRDFCRVKSPGPGRSRVSYKPLS